jgi:hypothetical protein
MSSACFMVWTNYQSELNLQQWKKANSKLHEEAMTYRKGEKWYSRKIFRRWYQGKNLTVLYLCSQIHMEQMKDGFHIAEILQTGVRSNSTGRRSRVMNLRSLRVSYISKTKSSSIQQ